MDNKERITSLRKTFETKKEELCILIKNTPTIQFAQNLLTELIYLEATILEIETQIKESGE